MTTAENVGVDMYVRHTDTRGHSTVYMHRVWDKVRFAASGAAAAASENARQKAGEPQLANFQQITEAQYHAERGAR